MTQTFPWEPGFNKVVITLNREVDGGLDLSDNTMSEVQYIVAKGPHVHGYQEGDEIMLDLEKLMITRPNPANQDEQIGQIKFTPIYDDDENMFALVDDRFIMARRRTSVQPLQSNE